MKIESFQGEFRFLSNFVGEVYPIELPGMTVEHLYQAAKAANLVDSERILAAKTPGEAKRLGRTIKVKHNWNEIRVGEMRRLVFFKFVNNPDLAEKLIATAPNEIIEGNWWGDTFWGVCNGKGENNMGKILMEVREALITGGEVIV